MPAGLSSSTLNLKFMQRAAARTPTSAPSTPGPTTSTPSKLDVTHDVGSSTPLPDGSETPSIASEEPYRWKIDRPSRLAQPALLIPTISGPRFESSYLPFMDQGPSEAGPSRSTNGGGGRMQFGFIEPEQEDIDEDLEDGADNNGVDGGEDDVVINVREGKEPKKHGRSQPSSVNRGFLRPRSRSISPSRTSKASYGQSNTPKHNTESSDPSTSRHPIKDDRRTAKAPSTPVVKQDRAKLSNDQPISASNPKNRHAAVEIKQEPASQRQSHDSKNKKKRKQSQASTPAGSTSTPSTASQGEKKPRLEPSLLNDHPSQPSLPDPAGLSTPGTASSTISSSATSSVKTGGTLDDREAALKAQRQKEKRARKRAKKAAVNAE